jgi:hypothetical protein
MTRWLRYPAEPDDSWEHRPECPAHPDQEAGPSECCCDELEWDVYDRAMDWEAWRWDEGGEA